MRRRGGGRDPRRPEYEGMGLGLFIAKTLLERSGADLSLANGTESFRHRLDRAQRTGAVVEVRWPRAAIASETGPGMPLGENQPIRA